jgi:hypothetical protein
MVRNRFPPTKYRIDTRRIDAPDAEDTMGIPIEMPPFLDVILCFIPTIPLMTCFDRASERI